MAKTQKRKVDNSLKNQLLTRTVLPLVLMLVVVSAVSIWVLSGSMASQAQNELKNAADLTMDIYDELYPGTFDIEMDENSGTYTVKKGDADITGDYKIVDRISENLDVDITLFCRNIRVITSLEDENGNRYITTKAATVVEEEVLSTGTAKFYSNVKVGDVASYAYYEPIRLEDGTIYGMIGVCKNATEINKKARNSIWPIVLTCLLGTILVGIATLSSSTRMISRINKIQHFTKVVASGDFSKEMPQAAIKGNDELSELARDSKKMQQAIKLLVEYDALTKLHNRRYGDKQLKEVVKKSENNGMSFCVGICDIDFFKKVNDTYGHDAGDAVLRVVADCLKKGMQGRGFVARWGGEEFLLVFENATEDKAGEYLLEILKDIRSKVITYDGQKIKVTMSMGVTNCTTSEPIDEMLKRADLRLYYAKEHGRNQIICNMVDGE